MKIVCRSCEKSFLANLCDKPVICPFCMSNAINAIKTYRKRRLKYVKVDKE